MENLLGLLIKDYKRFILCDKTIGIKVLFFTQGFWAILNYRITRGIFFGVKLPIFRQSLLLLMYLWRKLVEITTSIYLPWQAGIGKGLHIAHFGPIILNPETKMGDYCSLSQGVTIGVKQGGKYSGVPKIGNRVYIGPNAIIIGGIEVGDDAVIGAGAVVTKPVPTRAVVAGNPAKIISYNGSFDYIKYQGMENDPERIASMKEALYHKECKDIEVVENEN